MTLLINYRDANEFFKLEKLKSLNAFIFLQRFLLKHEKNKEITNCALKQKEGRAKDQNFEKGKRSSTIYSLFRNQSINIFVFDPKLL